MLHNANAHLQLKQHYVRVQRVKDLYQRRMGVVIFHIRNNEYV